MSAAQIAFPQKSSQTGPLGQRVPRDRGDRRGQNELAGRLAEMALNYQRLLKANPHHPTALVGMSLIALASGQTEAAVKMAEAGVAAAPSDARLQSAAWVALGQALKANGQAEEAERAYQQTLRLDGMNALARMGLGELKMAAGRAEEAAREFELALQRRPALAAAQVGLGNALALMGRNEEALKHYEQASALKPRLAEAQFAAGFVLARLGQTKEAEVRCRRALAIRPDFAAAWVNLGSLLREQGQDAWAETALKRAVELRPDLVAGWVNLAILERQRRRPAEAEKHLRTALALNPCQVETLVAWCQFRAAEQDMAGAWEWLRWVLARNPDHDEAVNMHGILLHHEGRFSEAVEAFERAEALGSKVAASNRGNSLLDLGRMEEAIQAHEAAVEGDPKSAGARYNLALTELRLGAWERGWRNYEARWGFREVHQSPRKFKQPRWQGEALEGQRVLLYSEQGLGDTIQFCRYAPLVAARGGVPVLEVQTAVTRLLRSLAVVREGRAEVVESGSSAAAELGFDLECPLISLPAVFGTTVETVPCPGTGPGAYLSVGPEQIAEKWKEFPGAGPRIGVAWAGNPRYKSDHRRSMRLTTLVPVLRTKGFWWVSLQKGPAAEQLQALPGDVPGDVIVRDGSSCDRDLAETAALMETLDLVITTDTCIAHLAGALNKPVWILVPYLADWRWMEKIETTPWYPSARLFRQSQPGDWAGVMERVIGELGRL